jgi:hypothetical protein
MAALHLLGRHVHHHMAIFGSIQPELHMLLTNCYCS